MEEELLKLGKEAVQEAALPNIAKPIVPMLGRLAYRTSYGQNVLKHSIEVAYLSQTIANELGRIKNVPLLKVGKPAPEIQAEDIDGQGFKLSDYRGKVVLLDFWGHW